MNNKKFGALSSSVDPSQFSQTAASGIQLLITGLGYFGIIHGIDASNVDTNVQQVTDALVTMVASGLAIYHAGQFVVGWVRKAFANPTVITTQQTQ